VIKTSDLAVDITLPRIDLPAITDAWRQAHFAAQAAAELGKAWGEEAPDDSHSSFAWLAGGGPVDGGVEGVPAGGGDALTARMRFADLRVSVHDAQGGIVDERLAAGATPDELTQWIRGVVEARIGPARQAARAAPDLPEHELAHGATFSEPGIALAQLAATYDSTDRVLRSLGSSVLASDPPRCWPHHFDLASLAIVERDRKDSMTKTIGVGVTPPDGLEPAGYWYVSPWQRAGELHAGRPALTAGRWVEREGALPIAILSMASMADTEDDEPDRASKLRAFVTDAVNASVEILSF